MRKKLGIYLLVVFAFNLIYINGQAALWNISDTTYTFNGRDAAGNTWVEKIQTSPVSGETYFKGVVTNYENGGGTSTWYMQSNNTSIQISPDGINWSDFINISVSSWTSSDNIKSTVGYDNILGAYFVENHKVDSGGNRVSASYIDYFVDGLGQVGEIDYYVPQNGPFVQIRSDWTPPTVDWTPPTANWDPPSSSAVPEPTTMLLFVSGIAGLVAVRKKKA